MPLTCKDWYSTLFSQLTDQDLFLSLHWCCFCEPAWLSCVCRRSKRTMKNSWLQSAKNAWQSGKRNARRSGVPSGSRRKRRLLRKPATNSWRRVSEWQELCPGLREFICCMAVLGLDIMWLLLCYVALSSTLEQTWCGYNGQKQWWWFYFCGLREANSRWELPSLDWVSAPDQIQQPYEVFV